MKESWNSDQGNIWIDQEVTLFILGTLVIDFIKWYFVAFAFNLAKALSSLSVINCVPILFISLGIVYVSICLSQ